MTQTIHIRGARTHNLQGIDLELPRDRLIVFTGLSGSGKSSLAFDTIYAEGQRRYVESLSAYARQFLSMMEKPDVDSIEGLSPAISIEQKSTSHNPRSTVGTVTEIYDYLRLLYARAGIPRCPDHGLDLTAQTVSQMVDQVLALPEGTALALIAPIISGRKGEHLQVIEELRGKGFVRARVDGHFMELDEAPKLDPKRKHSIDAVVDRLKVRPDLQQRLAESFETALRLGEGVARIAFIDEPKREELVFSDKFACRICGYSMSELEPRLFSFNNPHGACPGCDGLGVKQFFDPERVVAQPQLSLANGAVRGWDRRNAYYYQMIQALADHYRFDPEVPYGSLPDPRARGADAGERRRGSRVPLFRCARPHGQAQAQVRGNPAEPRAALPGNRIARGARGTRALSRHAPLSGMRRGATHQGRALRVRGRRIPAVDLRPARPPRARVLRRNSGSRAGAPTSRPRSSRRSPTGSASWSTSASTT